MRWGNEDEEVGKMRMMDEENSDDASRRSNSQIQFNILELHQKT